MLIIHVKGNMTNTCNDQYGQSIVKAPGTDISPFALHYEVEKYPEKKYPDFSKH